jgi:hypothetical protein
LPLPELQLLGGNFMILLTPSATWATLIAILKFTTRVVFYVVYLAFPIGKFKYWNEL